MVASLKEVSVYFSLWYESVQTLGLCKQVLKTNQLHCDLYFIVFKIELVRDVLYICSERRSR